MTYITTNIDENERYSHLYSFFGLGSREIETLTDSEFDEVLKELQAMLSSNCDQSREALRRVSSWLRWYTWLEQYGRCERICLPIREYIMENKDRIPLPAHNVKCVFGALAKCARELGRQEQSTYREERLLVEYELENCPGDTLAPEYGNGPRYIGEELTEAERNRRIREQSEVNQMRFKAHMKRVRSPLCRLVDRILKKRGMCTRNRK